MTTPLSAAFDDLTTELIALERAWTCQRELSGLRWTAGDLRHHVCDALAGLPEEPGTYDTLAGEVKVLVHEAFLSVLALGQLLQRALEDRCATPAAIARARSAVDRMLDLFSPLISRADEALRRVLLEHVSIATAVEEIARG